MLYIYKAMPDFKNSNGWDELKPAVLIFFGITLSAAGILVPATVTVFPEASIWIFSAGGASLLTGIKLLFEFRKSD